jgi:hypothetical protein
LATARGESNVSTLDTSTVLAVSVKSMEKSAGLDAFVAESG